MTMAVSDHYKELTAKILRSDLETYDNAKNLMAMARHIRHECPDNKFCFDYITSTVKENWLSWALVSKDPRFEQIYFDALLFEAPYIVDSFFRYIEVDDKIKFYAPRAKYLKKIVAAYQELYDGKLDFLSVSQSKRTGKALPIDTLITTPTGSKRIGDIKVGDTVIGKNGNPTRVKGVYPQGKKRVYEVTFTETGKSQQTTVIKASPDHIWTVRTEGDRAKKESRNMTTLEIMNGHMHLAHDKHNNYSVDYVKPIQYTFHPVEIDPYFLGCLIGDGCIIGTGSIGFNNAEQDIVEQMKDTARLYGTELRHISKTQYQFCHPQQLKVVLDKVGLLGLHSYEKFVPEEYKHNSINIRLEMLRGLLDTDGYVDSRRSMIEYSTTSKRLADDVVWLVKSLGGKAECRTRMGRYTKNGEHIETRINYRIHICFPKDGVVPVSSKKHLAKYHPQRDRFYHFISDIKETDEYAEMVCIEVDDPEHLYLLDDNFILTHNTSSALRLVAMFSGRHPEYGTLATGSGEDLVSVFYSGILKIFNNQRFIDVFPAARVKKTEAKRMNIDLQTEHMFPTVQCRPIDGAIVGSTEARNLLYLDDCVKNHEEAMNRDRLEFLDEKVTGDVLGRRIPGVTPILIQGTRYSLYDPIATLQEKARILKWRWKEVAIPALDPKTDKSNFEFVDSEGTRMFTTEDYRAERKIVTPEVWGAEFQQEPFEAKGRIFPHLNRFMKLPVDRKPDAVIFACDTAEKGSDFTSMPMAYLYGEDVFIPAVVYDDGSPEITKPKCANLIMEHKATSGMFESNSAGAYYGRDVDGMLKEKGYNCTILFSFSSGNKITRINEASNRIMEHFYFLDESLYTPDSDYGMFMREVTTITKSGKVPHDDASDSLAELDKYIRNLHGAEVKMISRKELGI